MKPVSLILAALFALALNAPSHAAEGGILNLSGYSAEEAKTRRGDLVAVKLRGKVNHFGNRDFHATVKGVKVWLAEYPESKFLAVTSGKDGWWEMNVLKRRGAAIEASFIYQKKGWATTKSNVFTIGDADDVDIAIQFIDPVAYYQGAKPLSEAILAKKLPPGAPAKLKNAMVVTVGKSWASMHDDRLPHGDPGALLEPMPGAVGPVYFDESVRPNPSYSKTSVDGGVAWLNVPPGEHIITASKDGVEYRKIKFIVSEEDVKNRVVLYIASPPDTVIGTNSSAPGED